MATTVGSPANCLRWGQPGKLQQVRRDARGRYWFDGPELEALKGDERIVDRKPDPREEARQLFREARLGE